MNIHLKSALNILRKKRVVVFLVLLIVFVVAYFLFFKTLTINPNTEARQMQALEWTKQTYALSAFTTDGCSGNVSSSWSAAVQQLSSVSDTFAQNYADAMTIPFEDACVVHDQAYHRGEGGYVARLQADNALRSAIIQYGIEHTDVVQARTGLTAEEGIFLYELVADAVYRGVRLGGAPCTGQPYAWGYGYNEGRCVPNYPE